MAESLTQLGIFFIAVVGVIVTIIVSGRSVSKGVDKSEKHVKESLLRVEARMDSLESESSQVRKKVEDLRVSTARIETNVKWISQGYREADMTYLPDSEEPAA